MARINVVKMKIEVVLTVGSGDLEGFKSAYEAAERIQAAINEETPVAVNIQNTVSSMNAPAETES